MNSKCLWARPVLWSAALFLLSIGSAKADDMAYVGTITGEFGTVDLNTGVVTLVGSTMLGASIETLAGLAGANGILYGADYAQTTSNLYSIDPASGNLTVIGSSPANYDDFGSTNSGLFAIGRTDDNLYSISP